MKTLILAKGFSPDIGGVETYSEQVALAYRRRGHDVTVLTAHTGPVGFETRETVRIFNVGVGTQFAVFLRMLLLLRRLHKEEAAVDIVHATTWRMAVPPLLLGLQVPLIVSVHGREVFVVRRPLLPLMHWVFRNASLVAAVSGPILDLFQAELPFDLRDSVVAWNGISFEADARRHVPSPDFSKMFCMCRLVERKNLTNAVRAAALLKAEGIDFQFDIAGEGPEREAVDALIVSERLGQQVRTVGRIRNEEAKQYYKTCGIFLHPQISTKGWRDLEGFGISIADAMSFGAAAIAGANGGPTDFINDGETGILVEGRDAANIATAVRFLLRQPQRAMSISMAGRSFALEQLTWDRHVSLILESVGVQSKDWKPIAVH